MGYISHAKSLPAGKSGFIPRPNRIVIECIGESLLFGPIECLVELAVRGSEG
jgi:hypothetical protein